MKKKSTFERLKEGLEEVKEIVEGRKKPAAVYSLDPNAKEIRGILGVSQEDFASMIGVSVYTLRNWEQGQRKPEGAARVLLSITAREPQTVKRLVGGLHDQKPAARKRPIARKRKSALQTA